MTEKIQLCSHNGENGYLLFFYFLPTIARKRSVSGDLSSLSLLKQKYQINLIVDMLSWNVYICSRFKSMIFPIQFLNNIVDVLT